MNDTEAMLAALRDAISQAYQLGQTYWSLADSENYANHARAEITHAKFKQMREDALALLQAKGEESAAPEIFPGTLAELAALEAALGADDGR